MRKYLIVLGIIFLCGVLVSCLGVFYIDLGNKYAWLENRIIVKITGEKENALYYDTFIRPQVLNYAYDDKFIIAYQVYDGSMAYDSIQREEEKDSLFAQFELIKKLKYCYWIIDKETGKVFGPMKKKEFENRCKVMHIEAKMKQWKEKTFWEGREMQSTNLDSVTTKNRR